MTDKSYMNWIASNDATLLSQIGVYVKHHRINQNKTQEDIASAAAISRSTLSALERGGTVTTATLIRVLRVLDQLSVMRAFEIEETISPIAIAKQQKMKRKRARSKGQQNEDKEATNW